MGRQLVLAPPALALALALPLLCVLAADARPHLNLQPRAKAVNNRPIIGIMTQPVDGTPWAPYGTSAMNADYVKFLEAAGARVVPVPFDADQATLDHLFDSINGLLYPGGGDILNGTQYFYSCQHMFNRAVQENKAGGYFPLWGTCLGFQFLSAVVYGGVGCLSHVDAENISLPLSLSAYAPQSRLWSHADLRDTYLAYLSSAPVTENYHHWGVLTSTFSGNPALASFYNPIATSRDREGVEFIAAMEAKNYPFYAVQYHPERSLYEWDPTEQVDHSGATVAVMQYHARFFVSEARKSSHSFADPTEELNTLIYNYSPIYSWKLFQDDMQLYVFNGTLPVTERDVLEARARF